MGFPADLLTTLILVGLLTPSACYNFCNSSRSYVSPQVPTNIRQLRVGDIKIVAGLGDSFTVANGARSTSFSRVHEEYRGDSFSAGGRGSYEYGSTTFPNILKVFNRHLYGYAIGKGNVTSINARFNLAEAGATFRHMPVQARRLIYKMKNDPYIDFQNDWKIVNLFIGQHDQCVACANMTQFSPANYNNSVRETLDILKQNLPRTLVNLIEPFNLGLIEEMMRLDPMCYYAADNVRCACDIFTNKTQMQQLASGYGRALRDLIKTGRYDGNNTFAVVIQPFFRNFSLPRNGPGIPDALFFAHDCLHFSSSSHGVLGIALWNSMLSMPANKATNVHVDTNVMCPSTEYIPISN